MDDNIQALLVQARPYPLDTLRLALEEQAIEIRTASNCGEAALALWSDRPPHLVFTEAQLPDGNWANILTLAARASAPVNVIVVAAQVDVRFYIQAVERGAFDFIVPPLSRSGTVARGSYCSRKRACPPPRGVPPRRARSCCGR